MGHDPLKDQEALSKTKPQLYAKAQRQKVSGYDPESAPPKGRGGRGIGIALVLLVLIVAAIALAVVTGRIDDVLRIFRNP